MHGEAQANQETGAESAIRVHDLVKRYPKAKANAVDGVSFEVKRGEISACWDPMAPEKRPLSVC